MQTLLNPGRWWFATLALLRVIPTSDIHEAYRFFERLTVNGRRVHIACWPSSRYHIYWPNWLKRPVTLLVNHLAMFFQILRGILSGRVVIVREFTNWLFLPMALFLWPVHERIVLNINDNLAHDAGKVSRWAFRMLVRMRFRMLLLDGEGVFPELRHAYPGLRLLTPYFSVPDRRPSRQTARDDGDTFLVGFVGYFRRDKGGIDGLASAMRALKGIHGIRVALGTWDQAQLASLPGDVLAGVELHDTFEYAAYLRFVERCDAIVVLATPAYRLRHSGILVDSVSRGTVTLCPAYPLLSFQLLKPFPVGATYPELEALPDCVRRVRDDHDRLRANFDGYFRSRSAEAVNRQLNEQWAVV